MERDHLDMLQSVQKVLLNSIYGNFANPNSPLFDLDGAASITLTGQSVIKQAGHIANRYVNEVVGHPKSENLDIVVYGDTDSIYLTFEDIGIKILDEHRKLTCDGRNLISDFTGYLAEQITQWAKDTLFTRDSRLVFKREVIADAAVFLEKKRYIVRVAVDDHDNAVDKLKFTGVELVRSSHSAAVKKLIRGIVTVIFETLDQIQTTKAYTDAFAQFKQLDISDAAKRTSLQKLDEYKPQLNGITKVPGARIPAHALGAMMHNFLLESLDLKTKYPEIKSGSKIKTAYVLPNSLNISMIAFGSELPPEFDLQIDWATQFNKLVRPAIESLYVALGWTMPSTTVDADSFLQDLFG